MKRICGRRSTVVTLVAYLVALLLFCNVANAQTSTLSGVVFDKDGGAVPGATVVIKQDATGITTTVVTNTSGVFSAPALASGVYTVTIALDGFKTAVVSDVRLVTGTGSDVGKVTLDVSGLEETVTVVGASALVQTQVATVSSTLGGEELRALPMPSRNGAYALWSLPGVETTGGNARNTTVSGLSQETYNVTLNGVNVQSNADKTTDGFQPNPRLTLDAVEEVTLTKATQGADSSGQGAVQIKYTTRSGTNQFKGTLYEYYRDASLNTNYFFNALNQLPKPVNTLNQSGGSIGGPILLPHFDGHNKAFFFFNLERLSYDPQSIQNRTILSPLSQAGTFQYDSVQNGATVTQQINLLDLAARNGQLASLDPTVAKLLAQYRTAAEAPGGTLTGSPTNPNLMNFRYNFLGKKLEVYPTLRVDYNINQRHRISFVDINQTTMDRPLGGNPEAQFPGAAPPTTLRTTRQVISGTLRSTLSTHIVNEIVAGGQRGPHANDNELTKSIWDAQQGFQLNFGSGLSNVTGTHVFEYDTTPNTDVSETLWWLRGSHALSMGGDFTRLSYNIAQGNQVPSIAFGVATGIDPADSLFTTANFPGASTTNLTDARNLYALLTGRVSTITGTATLNANGQYEYMGRPYDSIRMQQVGTFLQDSWRASDGLTLNYGLRWDYQLPVTALSRSYSTATFADFCGVSGAGDGPGGRGCNLFKPGTVTAFAPTYQHLEPGTAPYRKDLNNFAPNFSAAWRPQAETGLLRAILGDPAEATIRGGYSVAYTRYGMNELAGIFGGNPGETLSATRSSANGNLLLPGETGPVLLRNVTRLGPPAACATGTVSAACVPAQPSYPFPMTIANNVAIFDPNLKLAWVDSRSLGLQRAVGKDTAIEVRYVGTRSHGAWATENWNEINLANGFTDEFKLAMNNLQSNIAAGRGNSFAYFGPGSGTSPLPIMLAYLNGVPIGLAGDPTKYTGANWTNTTLSGALAVNNPAVRTFVSDPNSGLYGNAAFRANGLAAGMPANFWTMNPNANSATIMRGVNRSNYDSAQFDLRRRLSHGFLVNAGYVYAVQSNSVLDTLSRPRYLLSSANTPHSWKLNTLWELPFGKGQRFGSDMSSWLDRVVGGWSFSSTGRFYKQYVAASGVRLVGMTQRDLQKAYKVRVDAATNTVYMFPDDIVLNTRRAFNVSATSPTGYGSLGVPQGRYIAPASSASCVEIYRGDCGEPKTLRILAPMFTKVDITFRKRVELAGSKNIDFQIDVFNVGGRVNFTPVFNPGTGATIFQTTSGFTSATGTFEPGGQVGQVMLRVNF